MVNIYWYNVSNCPLLAGVNDVSTLHEAFNNSRRDLKGDFCVENAIEWILENPKANKSIQDLAAQGTTRDTDSVHPGIQVVCVLEKMNEFEMAVCLLIFFLSLKFSHDQQPR